MMPLIVHPIPTTSIHVQGQPGKDRRALVEEAHLYALLSALVAKARLGGEWEADEISFFGAGHRDQPAQLADAVARWLQDHLTEYDCSSVRPPVLPDVHALDVTPAGDTNAKIAVNQDLLQLAHGQAVTSLAASIVHEVACRNGAQLRLDAYGADQARQLAQIVPDVTATCAANLAYYTRELVPVARSLEIVRRCTVTAIYCAVASELGGDDVYLELDGTQTWPATGWTRMNTGETYNLSVPVIASVEQASVVDLWDHDILSANDHLYKFPFKPDEMVRLARDVNQELRLERTREDQSYVHWGHRVDDQEQATYYLDFTVTAVQLEQLRDTPVPDPPRQIVHDEL
jgi:hypothetical protein